MNNKIMLENGATVELSQLEASLLVLSVRSLSEDGLSTEQKAALKQLREAFETVDF
jgi:hypothetical protein